MVRRVAGVTHHVGDRGQPPLNSLATSDGFAKIEDDHATSLRRKGKTMDTIFVLVLMWGLTVIGSAYAAFQKQRPVLEGVILGACLGPIGMILVTLLPGGEWRNCISVLATAVYPGVAHSPACRNQPRMSRGVTRRSASPTAS